MTTGDAIQLHDHCFVTLDECIVVDPGYEPSWRTRFRFKDKLDKFVGEARESLGQVVADALQAELTAMRQCIQAEPMIPMLKHIIASAREDAGWTTVRPPFVPLVIPGARPEPSKHAALPPSAQGEQVGRAGRVGQWSFRDAAT